jgi:hypothetical protein
MASTFASYFGLRSTIAYTTAGTAVPAGSIYMVSSNVGPVWTNTITVSSLTGSTIAATSISLQSTTISLGQSTNQTYRNFTNGAYTNTLWGSTLGTSNVLSTVNDVIMSQSGQYQYALQGSQSSIATNQVSRSIDSGITWQTLNNTGLPVTTYAYQSTISGFPSYSNMTTSATGQYALTSVRGGQLYISNNANSDTPVFTPANVGGYPYIYMPFENSAADRMGNSVVTTTGSVAFNVPGKVGTNAMNLVNTAGSTATQYVRATWTGSNIFTMSFWFNAQTVGTQQTILGAYNGGFNFYVTAANVISCGITNLTTLTGPTITINTWYYVVLVMQTSGVCSMYVNNRLSSSATPTLGGWSALTTSVIQFGSQDVSSAQAFNGYIDDFEIYHFAAPNVVNPLIYLPMEGATTDVMSGTTLTTTGSPGYVPGVVGSQALKLTNTAGGTAVQYVRGTWTGASNFTISFWFNTQSLGQTQVLCGAYATAFVIYINASNTIGINIPSGGTVVAAVTTSYAITSNTWYYVTFIFQTNATCSLYVNNSLVGTYMNSGGVGIYSTTAFGIGTYDNIQTNAFNGYIDDFRIYNGAIPYSPINPMNWSQTAVSPTGQYMLAAASNGGVFQSSNFGASWSQLTNSQITSLVCPGQAAMTINGPTITPQLTGLTNSGTTALTTAPWTTNGITWVASTSSIVNIATFSISNVFNNNPTSGNYWANSSQTYTISGNSSSATTVIQGVGTATGDWAQIQSSVPLVMASYQFATGGSVSQLPKTYYIVGSNDGTTWYPIQFGSAGAVTTTAAGTLVPGVIVVTSASTQTFGSSTITTTIYSTTTNAYTYFRLIGLSTYSSSASYFEIGEWYINFTLPMPLYVAPSSMIIAPQLTGLASSGTALTASWTAGGVSWVASASSVYSATYPVSYAFNNTASSFWTGTGSYTTTGNTASSTTFILGGIGSIQGDWLQIQSSIPLVMPSYQFAMGGAVNYMPKNYYIVGSNDGVIWYPIQYGAGGTLTTTPANTLVPGTIIVYSTGAPLAQTFGSSTITTTAYSTAANAYTYFRLIGVSAYNTGVIEIGEWYINFSAPAPSNTSLLTVTPQQTGLAAANWTTANGVSWVANASSVYGGGYVGYLAFNNVTAASTGWASQGSLYNTTTGAYTGSVSTTILGGVGAQTGEWLQIQSSVPIVLQSHTFAISDTVNRFARIFYIVGSTDGSNWYPIQYASMTTNPFTVGNSTATNYLTVNTTGAQTLTAGASATVTTTSYSTSTASYIYFRIIINAIFPSNDGLTQIGEWYINFTTATPNPVNTLAISNTNMMVSATGVTSPQLSGLASNSWTVNRVNWTSSASSNLNTSFFPYGAFNNFVGLTGTYSWCSASGIYNPTSGLITGTAVSTTILGGIGAVSGEWVQIQSSVPLILSSYTYASGGNTNNNPKTYYIIGSTDGTSWYPIQYANMTTNPNTAAGQACNTYITVNQSGVQSIVGGQVGSGTFTTYATTTSSYLYFRFIGTSVYPSGGGNYQWGQLFLNFQSGANYISTNNGSTWSTALTAPAPLLATAGSYVLTGINQTAYLYSNGITGTYTIPTLTGINANIVSAAMSATSQYMVIVTQGTTNNVFYSTNYGVTFTALTIGNSAMTSCAMSADGSYLTVSSATQVYTLNRNTQGFSITLGNQAGFTNQGLNTVAIGNQAGLVNQSANSIVLNASTAAVNAYSQGFYVAPIASADSSSMSSLRILGYGADNQIVQSSSFVIGANGNVGIGTANPGSLLNVYGMMPRVQIIDVSSNRQPSIEFLRGQTSFDGNPSYSNWRIVASGGQADGAMPALAGGMLGFYHNGGGLAGHRLVLSDLGNVGIGITNPGYALHVVGAIYATGDIAALSDQRYKQNIVRLDRSLENLLQLSGYSYTREDYRPGEKQIGLLAQEVATVFPEAVQYDEANDKYGVNYNCLIAPLVESIKSLHERINTQDQIIAQLVHRLGPL